MLAPEEVSLLKERVEEMGEGTAGAVQTQIASLSYIINKSTGMSNGAFKFAYALRVTNELRPAVVSVIKLVSFVKLDRVVGTALLVIKLVSFVKLDRAVGTPLLVI